jgi:hypothetical protein
MTKTVVLYTKVGEQSAHILAEALKADCENPYETDKRDFSNYDCIFKFGFSRPVKAVKGATINKAIPTQIAIDKLKTFDALIGCDITVAYTTDKTEAHNWLMDGHILVARRTSSGSNGDGLSYIQSITEFNNSDAVFWTKLIDEVQELRVYIWKKEVLSIYVKTINNNSGVFDFKLIKKDDSYNHPQLVDLVNKVYNNIGLDFCGLDIITDTSGKLNLLEINSSPILFPYTVKQLVSKIKEIY